MKKADKKNRKLEDIVELDDCTLSLADIESIARDASVQKHFVRA
jgi:hypothetical protein